MIDLEELKVMLSGNGDISEREWRLMLEEADKDGDGLISLEEFKKAVLFQN